MWINELKLKNFRSYDNLEMIFEKGINYLIGKNGCGKTNLIEAIYYISNLESFRTNEEKSLIEIGKDNFKINVRMNKLLYEAIVNKENKILNIDGINYKKYRDFLGKINVVEFCPEEVYLLKDFPKERRKFIDKELSKIDYDYLTNILVYNKLLKQRNELLKCDDKYKEKLIVTIDERISEIQVKLIDKRIEFLKGLERKIKDINTTLLEKYSFEIKYNSSFINFTKEEIFQKYRDTYEKDMEKENTSLGIHKDDFKILINDIDASNYGSQGEQRMIILLVKLALANLIKERINDWPIVILDDVFSELDDIKKKEIVQLIRNIDQVFITGCEDEELEDYSEYEIELGKISKKGGNLNE